MDRTQRVLIGLLAAQLLLIVLLRSPFSGGADTFEPRPLLTGLDEMTPTRVELVAPDQQVTLVREGDAWIVAEVDGFPADAAKVDRLVETLTDLEVRRPVVSSSRYHDTFEVGDTENVGRVTIWGEGTDEPAVDLIVGSSPNYRITHVRPSDDDRVYEVRGLGSYDVRPELANWIDKQLVELDPAQVEGLVVTNVAGTLELTRGADGAWQLTADGQTVLDELDAGKIDALVAAASSLRLSDPVGPVDAEAHGLAEPAATVTVRYRETPPDAEPSEITIRIGGLLPNKDTQRYIGRSGFNYTGAIWESSVAKLLDETRDSLLKAEAESPPDEASTESAELPGDQPIENDEREPGGEG